MNNIIFNYYAADIKNSKPLGNVSLFGLINSIKNPKPNVKEVFEQIRIAEEVKDLKLKNDLKTKLFSVTPCVFCTKSRKYVNIVNWTGLVHIDFDHLENDHAISLKDALFNEYKFIIATWLSSSKHGVKVLIKIPVCTSVEEFKHYFNALEDVFSIYHGFDRAPKNCILPLFISYDENILYRSDPETWTKKIIPVVAPPIIQYAVTDKSCTVEKIMNSAINKIVDNGHPQLRAAAFSLGGYVGAGYIEQGFALSIIEKMIDSNAYLSHKPLIYKKTAKEMIQKGISTPLYLKS